MQNSQKKFYRGFERNVLRCNADRKSEGSGLCDPDDFSVQWRVFSMQHRDIWNWISVRKKVVCNVSADGKPESGTHKETTLAGADRIKRNCRCSP